jgi:hypothetical protein
MIKYNKYIIVSLLALFISISACKQENYDIGTIETPTNVKLTFEVEGLDAENPNGDGSGLVHFTAVADDEISFNFDFGDDSDNEIVANGKVTHPFTKNGTNTYTVTVYAIGKGGVISGTSTEVEVLSNFSDEEAVQFLTGGNTKSWYWAADQRGHLGLGPNNLEYGPDDHTRPAWYEAGPWEKSGTSLYDCELKFTLDNGNVTFEQINPTGEAFIQASYASELGLGGEGSYPFDIDGIKNVSFSPSASIATVDGQYRGTTMDFSDGGFMGFYAGSGKYEIIEITENVLKVRMVQANNNLFAWYHIFTNVKPIE